MNKKEKIPLKSQQKIKLREKRFNNLAAQLKSNILKRKKNTSKNNA